MRVTNVDYHLTVAAYHLEEALENLHLAENRVCAAFDGDEPGYPTPDSRAARAWDYLDAIDKARRVIGNRLNTWDDGDFDE